EGDVAEVLDLHFAIVDDRVAHLELGLRDRTGSEPAEQQENNERRLNAPPERNRRTSCWRATHPFRQQPDAEKGSEIEQDLDAVGPGDVADQRVQGLADEPVVGQYRQGV